MIVVIGGGAVGLAVAAELAQVDDLLVLERNASIGLETSSHNSGVVHAGIYYETGSLKHSLCIEGNALMYEWAGSHSVRINRLGKLIVATGDDELEALDGVAAQAESNAVPGIRRITAAQARALEPGVACVAALYSESSGVVDQMGYMRSLASALQERGAALVLQHEVTGIERTGSSFSLNVRDSDGHESTLECDVLINSGGLAADRLAALAGYPLDGGEGIPRMRQVVNKGRYYDIIDPEKGRGLRHLVYPVPEHGLVGLGVHVTLDIDGAAHLGPDTEWIAPGATLDYRNDDGRHDAFWQSARRYLPALESQDIAPGQIGYRPKLQGPGEPAADFLVWHDRGYVHLGGIESPGLTSSLALARHVRQLLT